MNARLIGTVLAALDPAFTHREVEQLLLDAGWTPCGAGDWAIAIGMPDEDLVARISPFDPVGPFTAQLYEEAAATGRVPRLFAHRRLSGGGDLQLMERLSGIPEAEASEFWARFATSDPDTASDPDLATLLGVVTRIHARARERLSWCGPLDDNPSNIMRTRDGRSVLTDPFYADGPELSATAERDPDRFVATIPEHERRFMTEIPLAASGPWAPSDREALRRSLLDADRRRARLTRGTTPPESGNAGPSPHR